MKYRRLRWIVALVIVLVVVLYPFESIVVPEWKIKIVNERGEPIKGKFARESWAHYSLELNPSERGADRWSDDKGFVIFPKGTIRASLVRRAIFPILTSIYSLAHGSTGIRADVTVWYGTDNMPKSLNYEPGKPLPDQIVVPVGKKGES